MRISAEKESRTFALVLVILIFIFLMGTLVSCGIGVRARALFGGKVHVHVDIAENANQNSPVATELVLIYDEPLSEKLMGMTAKEWFEQRYQIKKDYLEGEGMETWEWEWVPGQNVPIQILPLKPNAIGGIIFINYHSEGAHRFRIDPFQDILIRFSENDAVVEPITY